MIIGRELLREILGTSTVRPVLDAGLDRTWLSARDSGASVVFSGEERQAYAWVLDHWERHRKVPGLELFRLNFPEQSLPFPSSANTLDELIEESVRISNTSLILSGMSDVTDYFDKGYIDEAVDQIKALAHRLGNAFSQQDTAVTLMGDPENDLRKMMDTVVEPGVPVGFTAIDEKFYGCQPGQLITLLGRQKSGKTTLMANSAYQAWRDGWSVLFFSVEMDPDILMQRVLSIGAHVSPERFRRGKLWETEKKKVLDLDAMFSSDIGDVPFRISKKRTLITMDDVISETQQYRPHIVYIDGFYFMRDRITGKTAGPDWQAHENLAAELKTFAAAERIPIFVSTQVQEKQHDKTKPVVEGSSMMGGTGLLRYADLVLGSSTDAESVTTLNEILSRYDHVPTIQYRIDWSNMDFDIINVEERA